MVHFDGFYISVYFATFPSEYLATIRNVDVNIAGARTEKVKLKHTRRYNLLKTVDRTDFIKEFVALLRFIAAGEANIGHLSKDSVVIHRGVDDDGKVVLHPPQEAMDEGEQTKWREVNAWQYTE